MYLLEETEEAREMRENVKRLLQSNNEANIALALQTIEGGGFHKEFEQYICLMLFARYLVKGMRGYRASFGEAKGKITKYNADTKHIECKFMGKEFGMKISGFASIVTDKLELKCEPIVGVKQIETEISFEADTFTTL